MPTLLCPCCSNINYSNCCKPFHIHETIPKTPEALMRSRYCAYVLNLIDYLVETTHFSKRHLHQKEVIKSWAESNSWLHLEICKTFENVVEFKAYYKSNHQEFIHHERSTFKKENGKWYYLSGVYFDAHS